MFLERAYVFSQCTHMFLADDPFSKHEVLSKGFPFEVPHMFSRSLCLSPVAYDSPHVTQILGTRQTPPVLFCVRMGSARCSRKRICKRGLLSIFSNLILLAHHCSRRSSLPGLASERHVGSVFFTMSGVALDECN